MRVLVLIMACTILTASAQDGEHSEQSKIIAQMKQVVLPEFTVTHMELGEVFQRFTELSMTYGGGRERVQFHVFLNTKPSGTGTTTEDPKISITLKDVSLHKAVDAVCKQANLRMRPQEHAMLILGPNVDERTLVIRLFPVDPDVVKAHWGIDSDPAGIDYKAFFEQLGVDFKTNEASISYDRATRQLIVRNTLANQMLIERTLARLNRPEPQLAMTIDLIEADVTEAELAKVDEGRLARFIENLPDGRVKTLISKSQRLQSEEEGFIQSKGDVAWNGGNGYETSMLTLTPKADGDNKTISISCHSVIRIWNSKQTALTALSDEDRDMEFLTCDWESEIRTEFMTSSGKKVYLKVTAAQPHLKRGAIFLAIRATTVDAAGTPR